MISLVFFYELFVIFNYRMTKKGKIGKAIKKEPSPVLFYFKILILLRLLLLDIELHMRHILHMYLGR